MESYKEYKQKLNEFGLATGTTSGMKSGVGNIAGELGKPAAQVLGSIAQAIVSTGNPGVINRAIIGLRKAVQDSTDIDNTQKAQLIRGLASGRKLVSALRQQTPTMPPPPQYEDKPVDVEF
jgi:hypothetical protein